MAMALRLLWQHCRCVRAGVVSSQTCCWAGLGFAFGVVVGALGGSVPGTGEGFGTGMAEMVTGGGTGL